MKSMGWMLIASLFISAPAYAAENPTVSEVSAATDGITPTDVPAMHPEDLPRGAEQPAANSPYEENIEIPLAGGSTSATAVTRTANIPVVLADFSDHEAETALHPSSAYASMLFQDEWAGGAGSMRDFYQDMSGGMFDVTGDVSPWLRMPNTYAAYSGNSYGYQTTEPNDRTLVRDAASAADPSTDFCKFDTDGDGIVDIFYVVHAGPGAEEVGTGLWSVQWRLSEPYETGDVCSNGKRATISKFVIVPEEHADPYYVAPGAPDRLISIGIFVHEFGHVLGLPDLYDIDHSSPGGVGPWDVMSVGSWGFDYGTPWRPTPFSAWSLAKLGWAIPKNVTQDSLGVRVPSVDAPRVGTFNGIYRIAPGGSATSSEYFLVENRERRGWAADLPGGGLAVWHVDDSRLTQGGNTDDSHRLVELVQADGLAQLNGSGPYGYGDLGDLFPGSGGIRSLTGTTTPDTDLYSGAESAITLDNIGDAGPSTDTNIFITLAPTSPPAAPTNLRTSVAGSGVRLDWTPSETLGVLEQRVYRSTAPTSGFTRLATVAPSQQDFGDATAQPGETYYYRVTTYDRAESAPSNVATATLLAVPDIVPVVLTPEVLTVTTGKTISGSVTSLGVRDGTALALRSFAGRRAHKLRYRLDFDLASTAPVSAPATLTVATMNTVTARVFGFAPSEGAWIPLGFVTGAPGASTTLTIEAPERFITNGALSLRFNRKAPDAFAHKLDMMTLTVL